MCCAINVNISVLCSCQQESICHNAFQVSSSADGCRWQPQAYSYRPLLHASYPYFWSSLCAIPPFILKLATNVYKLVEQQLMMRDVQVWL